MQYEAIGLQELLQAVDNIDREVIPRELKLICKVSHSWITSSEDIIQVEQYIFLQERGIVIDLEREMKGSYKPRVSFELDPHRGTFTGSFIIKFKDEPSVDILIPEWLIKYTNILVTNHNKRTEEPINETPVPEEVKIEEHKSEGKPEVIFSGTLDSYDAVCAKWIIASVKDIIKKSRKGYSMECLSEIEGTIETLPSIWKITMDEFTVEIVSLHKPRAIKHGGKYYLVVVSWNGNILVYRFE